MSKKGFTLVELLAVIVLLGIIMVIAFPAIGGVSSSVKKEMLTKKLNMIEESAILYGQDFYKGSLVTTSKRYKIEEKEYSCETVKIRELVEQNYLDADNSECDTNSESSNCVINPVNEEEYLDDVEVIIYYKNKRIKAIADIDDKLTCE